MTIRKLTPSDRATYLDFVYRFYHSEAVLHPVPDTHFEATFSELMASDTYAECFFFEEDNKPVGYALLAKTFSQEAGGLTLWIEELFVLPEYRSCGFGSQFFAFLEETYPHAKRLRLEVEEDNTRARALYERKGFTPLPYLQLIKE